jgi:hypothetical protein
MTSVAKLRWTNTYKAANLAVDRRAQARRLHYCRGVHCLGGTCASQKKP